MYHYLTGAWSDPTYPLPVNLRVSVWNATGSTAARGLSPRLKMFLEILMVLMCLGAVTGNILVIVIVAATKNFHSVTSVLIINLAISDLLVGVGVMPFVAMSIMNNGWVDVTNLCLYVGYTSSVYCTASVLTLAAIALDRYHSIMDCLRYSARCTLWRTCSVVLWIWLQAMVTSFPPLLGWSTVDYVAPMYSCAVNWASSPSYTAFMACLSFLMPAVVILFCYVNIVRVARSHARRIHSLEDHLQRSRGNPSSSSFIDSISQQPPLQQVKCHIPSRLVYHLTGRFISELHGGEESSDVGLPNQATSGAVSMSHITSKVASSNPAASEVASMSHTASKDAPFIPTACQTATNSAPSNLVACQVSSNSTACQAASDSAASQNLQTPPSSNSAAARRLFSLLAQSVPTPAQYQHQPGLVRLFLVIFAFFLCWTPYIGVALVQATETALSCKSSLVPPSAVTFSYWLALLNSDINPLLYALLSKRFQGALWCLRQKIRARLGMVVERGGGGGETRAKGGERRSTDLCTVTRSIHPDTCSGPISSSADQPACCSAAFTLNSSYPEGSGQPLCGHFLPSAAPSGTSPRQETGGQGNGRSLDCLQVPSRPSEGSRLPFSSATKERQATFFYGQITVRVEHDVC